MRHDTPRRRRLEGGPGVLGLTLAASIGAFSGCDFDTLLDVELPHSITEDALSEPGAAELLVSSVIAHFECGYAAFTYEEFGRSDGLDRHAGRHSGNGPEYSETVGTGRCSEDPRTYNWFTPLQMSRSIAFDTYDNLTEWTVPRKEEHLATTAVYAAASLGLYGEHFCEFAVDAGPLMTQDQTLALAEEWVDRAIGHIASNGDFALRHGATESIETMAYALRARIRWARGPAHWDGALQDALRVPEGYTAWVTRDNAPTRANKIFEAATDIGYGHVHGPISHWQGPPNPATGQPWPDVIPFTGYLDLGILPDGRAISDARYPITTTEYTEAVEDHRVRTRIQTVQGPEPGPVPVNYLSPDEDQPLVSWRDIWLIRAEIEGGQAAIDRVNDLRTAHGLPLVTYADPNDADQILDMIIEERRRDLWLEGRFWSTKIRNPDRLWFPRRFGSSVFQSYAYGGGVSVRMATSEYELNPNLDLSLRATGCDPARAPVLADAG